jgi:hypothetical protein
MRFLRLGNSEQANASSGKIQQLSKAIQKLYKKAPPQSRQFLMGKRTFPCYQDCPRGLYSPKRLPYISEIGSANIRLRKSVKLEATTLRPL